MRILSATTKTLKISAVANSNECAISMDENSQDNIERLIAVDNAYLVLVCVELGDDAHAVKIIANRIKQQWDICKEEYSSIVLVPFGHLSDIAHPSLLDVARILNKLYRTLSNKGLTVYEVKPNKADCLFSEIMIFDSGSSVRFSSSASSLRNILKDILNAYGIKQTMSSLADLLTNRGEKK